MTAFPPAVSALLAKIPLAPLGPGSPLTEVRKELDAAMPAGVGRGNGERPGVAPAVPPGRGKGNGVCESKPDPNPRDEPITPKPLLEPGYTKPGGG